MTRCGWTRRWARPLAGLLAAAAAVAPAAQEIPAEALLPCLGCPSVAQLEAVGEGPIPPVVYEIVAEGRASFYGRRFHGRRTASGEVFDSTQLTAAHPSLPFGSIVRVTNLANGRSVVVRVNDRGPYVGTRVIDVSRAAAEELRMVHRGVARVRVELQVDPESGG